MFLESVSLVCSAGEDSASVFSHLLRGQPCLSRLDSIPVGRLSKDYLARLDKVTNDDREHRLQDPAVLLGWHTAGRSLSHLTPAERRKTITLAGSSRGTSARLVESIGEFVREGRVNARSSPTSTSSVFATYIARREGLMGMASFVSGACATGLQILSLAKALTVADPATSVLSVTSEACLNPFTFAQMQRLGVLTAASERYPCKPLSPDRDGMALAEGAAAMLLTGEPSARTRAQLSGISCKSEASSMTGVTSDGRGLQQAIVEALKMAELRPSDVSAVFPHATGTKKGDRAELLALDSVFDGRPPAIIPTKWCYGHTLATSAQLSVAMAIEAIEQQCLPEPPYVTETLAAGSFYKKPKLPIRHVLVNALGFGGINCAAIVSALT